MASLDYEKLIALAAKGNSNKSSISSTKIKKNSNGPDPRAIQSFLVKKKLEEHKKLEEERAKREKLLFLRSMNSKSNKAAKLMASRTKDNDYSKIILTEKDITVKERVDAELRKKGIGDKLNRMKERIEIEQNVEESSRKKKKICLSSNHEDRVNYNYNYDKVRREREEILRKNNNEETSRRNEEINKSKQKLSYQPPKFEDLLKLAEQKQKVKKTLDQEIEEEILYKKQTKEEKEKELKRKKEEFYQKNIFCKKRLKNDDSYKNLDKVPSSLGKDIKFKKNIDLNDKKIQSYSSNNYDKNSKTNKPLSKISKYNHNEVAEEELSKNKKNNLENILDSKPGNLANKIANLSKEELLELSKALQKAQSSKSSTQKDEYLPTSKVKSQKEISYRPTKLKKEIKDEYVPTSYHSRSNKPIDYKPTNLEKSNEPEYIPTKIKKEKNMDAHEYSVKSQINKKLNSQRKLIDIDTLTVEEIEKIRKERLEKQEKEERERLAEKLKKSNAKLEQEKRSKNMAIRSNQQSLPPIGATYRKNDYNNYYKSYDNAYDDYEEEEDDEMNDFIDDGDDLNAQEEISKCIREVFHYDKRKYLFDDDDDIEESSFAQQMKEENFSTRIGLLEDLEDIQKEEQERRRKAKLRKKGRVISDSEED